MCYKWNVQLTCQVPRPPRSRESNDPFEEKRCHYMKSLRNILSSSYGGERTSVLQIELHNSPVKCHAPQGHVNPMTPIEEKRCHYMKSLRNISSSSYGGERGKCATNGMYNSPVKCHAPRGHVNPMTLLRRKGVTT